MSSTSEKRTDVALVLDRSGSMSSIREQAIDGFNEQLKALREEADKGGDTRVTVVTFGGWHGAPEKRAPLHVINERVPAEDVEMLSMDNYRPNGLTPLYDGFMHAIDILEESDDGGEDTAFLVVVVSDGRENHSKEFTAGDVASKVRALEDTDRWTIVYIGANQDLSDVEKHLAVGRTHSFDSTPEGTESMSDKAAGATMSYMNSRSAGLTSGGYDYGEQDEPDTQPWGDDEEQDDTDGL